MKKHHQRIIAALAGLTMAVSATSLAPTIALAQPSVENPTFTTVDVAAPVSLTINKQLGDPGDTDTGVIENVSFRIERVALDNGLDTTAGWEELAGITAENAPIDESVTFTDLTTTAAGVAQISTATNSDFTVGVYRITELQNGQYTVAAPFLVVLPFTNETTGAWNYGQVVSPKNQEIAPSLEVIDVADTLGETIEYTITAPVPAGDLTRFEIIDDLPLELGEAANVVVSAPGVTLVEGPDYTVITTGGDGNQLSVVFTPSGLAALEAARVTNPGLAVTVEFDTVLVAAPANGIIENHVRVNLPNGATVTTDQTDPNGPAPANPANPDDPEDYGNGTQTRLGNLTITKTNEAGELLPGASFQFYRCNDTDDDGRWTVTGDPLDAAATAGDPESVTTEFTTGTDGTVTLYTVQALNWVNNDLVDDIYCVVETSAPEDYALNPEPQPVQFQFTPAIDGSYAMAASVVNVEDTIIGQLPDTGGKGVMLIIIAGLAVVGAGGAVAVRGNRARNNA